ncbi:hypothetical protein CRUP_023583 [Coryphaenoides rupestris]|nr:hypothetical protein CRUP_023583 [Coryphaenoides rupestris]
MHVASGGGGGGARVQVAPALKHAALCLLLLPRFLVAAVMLWILDFLCIRKKVLLRMGEAGELQGDAEGGPDDPPVCVSDSNKMFTLESLRAVWYGQRLDFFKSAHVGHCAPNTEVVALRDRSTLRILDCVRGERPLILNFGSCS